MCEEPVLKETELLCLCGKVPAAWLSLFNVVFILVLLPVLDRVIYPLLDRHGISPSLRVRMLIGMIISVVAMLVAGCVEKHRMDVFWRNGTNHTHWQMIGSTYYEAANMSILYQIPQYALVAMGELFTSIAGLELAYIYAPRSMQGIIMAFYWFSQGVGSLFGSATIEWFEGVWFTAYNYGNINCRTYEEAQQFCHLDYYFWFVGGLQLVGIVIFIAVTWGLGIGRPVPLRVQRRGHTLVRPTDSPARSSNTSSPLDFTRTPRARPRAINNSQSPPGFN